MPAVNKRIIPGCLAFSVKVIAESPRLNVEPPARFQNVLYVCEKFILLCESYCVKREPAVSVIVSLCVNSCVIDEITAEKFRRFIPGRYVPEFFYCHVRSVNARNFESVCEKIKAVSSVPAANIENMSAPVKLSEYALCETARP